MAVKTTKKIHLRKTRKMLAGFAPVHETAELKGFNKPVPYLRITAEELAERRRRSADVPL
ncbi:MAG: hypothetical protein IIA50_00930 [Bacteroidetes bacterium]|nr:hypothetical protein [Bacteroidota bacterium]